jgi:hypothetical protein
MVTRPVIPVETIRTASSRGVSGAGELELVWLIGPEGMDVPRATRRVRLSVMADIKG